MWYWVAPTTFIVNLQFKCCISVLSLTFIVLYCPHFSPSYTLWILPFIPSLKGNPGCCATSGIPPSNTDLKEAAASLILVDIPWRILSWLRCSNVVPGRIILQLVLITPFFFTTIFCSSIVLLTFHTYHLDVFTSSACQHICLVKIPHLTPIDHPSIYLFPSLANSLLNNKKKQPPTRKYPYP